MVMKDMHHPVTNGKTKTMVFMSIIFIFIITIVALSFAFTASFGLAGIPLFLAKGLFGTVATTGLGALVAVTRKFFDTRTSEVKSADKLAMKKESHEYKLKKMEIKKKK